MLRPQISLFDSCSVLWKPWLNWESPVNCPQIHRVPSELPLTPKSWLFERSLFAHSLSLVHVNPPQVWFCRELPRRASWGTPLTWSSDSGFNISASLLHKVSLGCSLIYCKGNAHPSVKLQENSSVGSAKGCVCGLIGRVHTNMRTWGSLKLVGELFLLLWKIDKGIFRKAKLVHKLWGTCAVWLMHKLVVFLFLFSFILLTGLSSIIPSLIIICGSVNEKTERTKNTYLDVCERELGLAGKGSSKKYFACYSGESYK